MSVSVTDLDDLRNSYVEMKERKRNVRNLVRERYRETIENAIERESEAIEREFAIEFEILRSRGATRAQLVSVIRTGSADVYRKYVELGGGVIRGRDTGEDAALLRGIALGVVPKDGGVFDLVKSSDNLPVEPIEVRLELEGDNHMLIPTDMDNFLTLRDVYGYDLKANIIKANQIAEVFDLGEGTE